MSDPKLHHYVPQFYLRRFANATGQLFVWDKTRDRSFATSPRHLAAEHDFYWHDELAAHGHDPLTLEKQLSNIEGETSRITSQWLEWLPAAEPGERIPIPDINRKIVSQFMAIQVLRTLESRTILGLFAQAHGFYKEPSEKDLRALHLDLVWHLPLVNDLTKRILESTWLFGVNGTTTPFITSDHPIAFRAGDNRMWLKVHVFTPGTYVVYPMAPNVIMYCYPNEQPWTKVDRFSDCRSPVEFTPDFVESENAGQVFMASRFLFSPQNDFADASAFAKTISKDPNEADD
ncbi:DUF4238 domain-containing protein [Archangium sp.]|jgi:hypothetical protein|uniref:DUF4238 domain-containing protein n=1 Tax=Archangium sp. TaxID=1872627 RepID=UPI002ED9785E